MTFWTPLFLTTASTTFCTKSCLVSRGIVVGFLHDRRGPVGLVRRDRREPDVGLLGDGAGAGDFGRDLRDAADFVLGDDRAAREAPGAAVDDAHAEAGRADAPPAAAPASTAAAAAAAAAESAAAAPPPRPPRAAEPPKSFVAGKRVAAGRVHAVVGRAGEADVGVAAAGRLRFLERDVGQPLELGVHHAPRRRLREEVADEIAAGDDEAGGADGLDEISACV